MRSRSSTVFAALLMATSAVTARNNPFRWHNINTKANWKPAHQTQGPFADADDDAGSAEPTDLGAWPMLALSGGRHGFVANEEAAAPAAPATTPPAVMPQLAKRDKSDNTCGYVSGLSSIPLYCDDTEECVINSAQSRAGCCPDTSINCPVHTTCLALSQSSLFSNNANGHTLFCNNVTFPECITHRYIDTVFTGYTLLGCAKTKGVDDVYYLPTNGSTTTSPAASTTAKPSTTTTDPGTTTVIATASVEPHKKSHTGAIIGGVVGGLALVALGAFLLLRHRKKKNDTIGGRGAPHPQNGPAADGQAYYPPQQPNYGPAPIAVSAGASAAGGGYAAHQVQPGENKAYDPSTCPLPPNSPNSAFSHYPSVNQAAQPQASSPAATLQTIAPSVAPAPAPGMGFHSGPVPATFDIAELPGEQVNEPKELA